MKFLILTITFLQLCGGAGGYNESLHYSSHVLTALFKPPIYNKILNMAARAIDNIIEVLDLGKTMEARKTAATEIYRLSMTDDCKL